MGDTELKDLLHEREVLLSEAARLVQVAAALTNKINGKCEKTFEEIRTKTGQEGGTVNAVIDGYQVKQVIGKTVSWDQTQLDAIAGKIAAAGDNPADWMTKTWGVKEKEFKNWAPEIQAFFLPAKTTKPKTPTYEFKEVTSNAS